MTSSFLTNKRLWFQPKSNHACVSKYFQVQWQTLFLYWAWFYIFAIVAVKPIFKVGWSKVNKKRYILPHHGWGRKAILEALKRLYWNITAGFSACWCLRILLLKGRIKSEKGAFYTSSKKLGLYPRGPLAPAALTIKDFSPLMSMNSSRQI